VTNAENQKNRGRQKNSTGVAGVSIVPYPRKYKAQLVHRGKHVLAKTFFTLAEAVKAREDACVLHGFHDNHGK
jgi:hypothetical protein